VNENFTTIYIPIETFNKLCRIQTKLTEVLGKKPPLYKIIEMLMSLQVAEAVT